MPVQMMIAGPHRLIRPAISVRAYRRALDARYGWLMAGRATPGSFRHHLIAYRIGEDPRVLLPQMVCQDGFFVLISFATSITRPGQVKEYLRLQASLPVDPRHPVSTAPRSCPSRPTASARACARHGRFDGGHEQPIRVRKHLPAGDTIRGIEEFMTDDGGLFFLQGAHGVNRALRN